MELASLFPSFINIESHGERLMHLFPCSMIALSGQPWNYTLRFLGFWRHEDHSSGMYIIFLGEKEQISGWNVSNKVINLSSLRSNSPPLASEALLSSFN
jgi:hypothetical protein